MSKQCGVSRNLTSLLSSYLRAPQAPFPWARISPRAGSGAETTCGHQEAPVARSRGNWHREARQAGPVCTYMLSFVKSETEGLSFLGVA